MSRATSLSNAIRHVPTSGETTAEDQISLVDRTQPEAQSAQGVEATDQQTREAEPDDSDTLPPTPPVEPPLIKPVTSGSLHQTVRQQVARRRYRRYGTQSYGEPSVPTPLDRDPASAPQPGDEAKPTQLAYLERGRAKAKSLLKCKRTLHCVTQEDSGIDLLYENQRGAFLFGVPMFSSSSLLNFDPRPWQNAAFRTSPVDIRNAQVPDPSWEWAWKSWYVDMSRDVDEEGWEYSFSFKQGFAWHGNHPWFHSFVRRRRWLRTRVRKHAALKTNDKSHELTAEYFTIHPKTLRPASIDGSRPRISEMARMYARVEEDADVEKMDITDIGSLIRAMRKGAVDRQKLVVVRKFVDDGGDELYYLSDRMSEIMSLFLYQSSRRQLLSDLMHRFHGASEQRETLPAHEHGSEAAQMKHDAAVRHAENLLKAVRAADDQVKKLEYWSDIKDMARHGETLRATDDDHWDAKRWQGLDPSSEAHDQQAFSSKQHHSEQPPELHKHPEHSPAEQADALPHDENVPPHRRGSMRSEGREKGSSGESELSRYTTAQESASEFSGKRKGKGKASDLDGVQEGDGPEPGDDMLHDDEKDGVAVVEPRAIDENEGH